jgi:hypothetical protein
MNFGLTPSGLAYKVCMWRKARAGKLCEGGVGGGTRTKKTNGFFVFGGGGMAKPPQAAPVAVEPRGRAHPLYSLRERGL